MMPFYGGSVKQNMNDKSNKSVLENFTGVSDLYKHKKEMPSFYDKNKDVTNVCGMQSMTDFYTERMVAPNIRNNEFPIDKITVGPGLGKGFSSTPTGGYQQFDIQQYAKDRDVDQLRTQRNPNQFALGITDTGKETYEARVLNGMKGTMLGIEGEFSKNRVNTWYEQTPDMLMKTTGAIIKPKQNEKFNIPATNRLETTVEYEGIAHAKTNLARTLDAGVKETFRQQLAAPSFGTAVLTEKGKSYDDDYGKSVISVYKNERNLTSTRVYTGNLTTLVKSIIAPLKDIVKITKKQHAAVDNPRHFGNMNAQIPEKPTLYDPNHVARTTIKETTINDEGHSQIKGTIKNYVIDPNNVARTTIKETTINDEGHSQIKGTVKNYVIDPNNVARTTIKETFIHDEGHSQIKGTVKNYVIDPNHVARTTIKETTIHDEIGSHVKGPTQLYIYDPDEVAKTTIRETMENDKYEANMKVNSKGTVYDPNDVTKKTIKETTVQLERIYGNIDAMDGINSGYQTNKHDAKDTHKQFLADNDYYGGAKRDAGEGYITNEIDAKETQKQFLSDNDYYGGATSYDKKQTSYDDIYNANISEQKESILYGREPTQTGKKSFNGNISLKTPRDPLKQQGNHVNIDKIYKHDAPILTPMTTREKNVEIAQNQSSRFDTSLLNALNDNPYNISII
jgi:ribosomal protein S20